MFTPLQTFLGGLLLALASTSLLSTTGRVFGISGIVDGALPPSPSSEAWRRYTLLGLLLGPVIAAVFGTDWALFGSDSTLSSWAALPLPRLGLAGALVGLGSRLGSGCTSGHFLCGVSRGSPRSLVATGVFFSVAVGAAWAFPAPIYEDPAVLAGRAPYDPTWPKFTQAAVLLAPAAILYELHKTVLFAYLPRQRPGAADKWGVRQLPYLLCGTTFALGLQVSGMASPLKVIGFLRLLPPWTHFDPSLAMVVLGGVIPNGLHYYRLMRTSRQAKAARFAADPKAPAPAPTPPKPLLPWETWRVPSLTIIDARLVTGAALFGLGWGLAGVCPGPAVVGLSRAAVGLLRGEEGAVRALRGVGVFLGTMGAGMKAAGAV